MKDEISALMDGELDPEAAVRVIAQLKKADELHSEWVVYHLISDALGQTEALPADITQRVRTRLAAEPTVLAPRPPIIRHKTRVFAAAASVAAVAMIGLMNLQTTNRPAENLADNKPAPTTTNTAALQTAPTVISVSASLPAPAQINDYLLAHRQFSPSAMHGTAPYMHTVAESRENPR